MILELLAYVAWKRRHATYQQDLHGVNKDGIYAGYAVSANPVISYSPNDRESRTVACEYPATSLYVGPPFSADKSIHPVAEIEDAVSRITEC